MIQLEILSVFSVTIQMCVSVDINMYFSFFLVGVETVE